MTNNLINELDAIVTAIKDGTYSAGTWQNMVEKISRQDIQTRRSLREHVTEVSDLLHGRHGHISFSFLTVYLTGLSIIAVAAGLSFFNSALANALATLLFALTLQPVIKVTAGLLLGIRYSYAYLWHSEPRFKMRYGHYLSCPPWRRIMFQLTGSVGTPLAMLIGMYLLKDVSYLFWLCVLGLITFTLAQLLAFIAALIGIRRIGPFTLRHLTTPAMLGFEIKQTYS